MRHFSPITGKEETCTAASMGNCPYGADAHINNFEYAVREANEIKKVKGEDSFEYKEAIAFAAIEEAEWDATPDGIKELEHRIETENNVGPLRARLHQAKVKQAVTAAVEKEYNLGRPAIIAQLAGNPNGYFDEDEMNSIVDAAIRVKAKGTIRNGTIPRAEISEVTYNSFCDDVEKIVKRENDGKVPEDKQKLIDELRQMERTDSSTHEQYKKLIKENLAERSREQVKEEIKKLAAFQSVDFHVAEAYYNGYREQYLNEYAHLPEAQQPNPPKRWVEGKFQWSGFRNDFNSNLAPSDKATMYAVYRLRSDSKAIPENYKKVKEIASIDLETAGPSGKSGLEPQNGSIIEVGVVTYNPNTGKEISRYEQLIKPDYLALKRYGTGAVEIHQITEEDVKDSPDWGSVKEATLNTLRGRTLLAQNHFFEHKWLAHHGDKNLLNSIPIIDTLDMSRKHNDTSNHKLETICNTLGVPYTNGHRATHDALVTAQAYFQFRKNIERAWRKKPARANAAPITALPKTTRYI